MKNSDRRSGKKCGTKFVNRKGGGYILIRGMYGLKPSGVACIAILAYTLIYLGCKPSR